MAASSSARDKEKQVELLGLDVDTVNEVQDGGLRAWLQVAGAFLVFGNIWALTFSFGSFESYYQLELLAGTPASSISWIGTVAAFLLILIGVFSGPLFDLGYFKTMLLAGSLVGTLSVFLTSICHTYWELMLTQGVLQGLGNGLLYVPVLAFVGRSFEKHRALAMAITTCGAPVGSLVHTLIFEQLISKISFAWTVRIMAFVLLASYCISFPLLLWGVKNIGDLASGTPRKLFDRAALTNGPFWAYCTANFLIFCAFLVPFNFTPSYGQVILGMSRDSSLYVAMAAQASSVLSRLVAGYATTKIGLFIPWITCVTCSAIVCIAWIGVDTVGGFYAIAALYGCFSGALVPLAPSAFPVVCPDQKVLGARLGMAQAIISVANLIGSPMAAAVAEASSSDGYPSYLGLQLFNGLVMLAGAINLIFLWVVLAKRRNGGSKLI